ncbi:MAG: Gfo/Idh/MocA family oxidoreductase [Actinomycetota bacterium]|nr:Gfo/Idh/MocA family oxidoreductase [Actinomycetota bacterium]
MGKDARVGVGIVGLGDISSTYIRNLTTRFNEDIHVVGGTDVDAHRVDVALKKFDLFGYRDLFEMLADPRVEMVLNLTNPLSHAAVSEAAVAAGKHVYSEKPLTVDYEDACRLLEQAQKAGVLVGCAPDTFLGDGLQTCRRTIDAGEIGDPIAATAFMVCHGHESWHPSPAFFYRRGAGPMMDMGPYYLTALVSLMGPIRRVTGFEQKTFPTRTITSQPLVGDTIDVEIPTHVSAILEFVRGAIATVVMSFDVWAAQVPHLEIYGTAGSLSLPDPNTFGGPVSVQLANARAWRPIDVIGSAQDDSRGLGIADLALAVRSGATPRASGELACHVLEAMHGIHASSMNGRVYVMQTRCLLPPPARDMT